MNNKAQFTPGPYELRGPRLLTDSNGVVLADNIGANWPGTIDGQANLFTAAPAMYEALAKLRLEAIHYRNTGVGVQFLNHAIDQAELAINQVWGEGESNYDTEREG